MTEQAWQGKSEEGPPGLLAAEADRWLDAYRDMLRIRQFEDTADQLYQRRLIPGLTHLSSGEEAVAVGVCMELTESDFITSTHRGHGHCLAKGARPDRMFAELLGKAAGYCGGKGGSMHIADPDQGNLGANAIVGGSAGIATGAALSNRQRGTNQVAVCFFGDGALGQGILYEAMNMAALWALPVIYVCEHNLYGEYTPTSEVLAGSALERPRAFGVPALEVDGQDVVAVRTAAGAAIARARSGAGPAFLLCHTYRYFGHHVGDVDRGYYRGRDEERYWCEERDPLQLLRQRLEHERLVPGETFARLHAEVETEIAAGVEFALAAPYPAPEEVTTDVYA